MEAFKNMVPKLVRWLTWQAIGFTALFLIVAPLTIDLFNTGNMRAFLDLLLQGNPYSLASGVTISFRGVIWPLDWPYPPPAVGLVLPAWVLFRVTGFDPLYQLIFKLPMLIGVLATAWLIRKESPAATLSARLLSNPAVFVMTAVLGGFDAVAMPLILATYIMAARGRWGLSAIALGSAIGLRMYPAVLIVPMVLWICRQHSLGLAARYALSTGGIAVIWFSSAMLDVNGYLQTLTTQSNIGPFGIVLAISLPLFIIRQFLDIRSVIALEPLSAITMLALFGYWWIAWRRNSSLLGTMLGTLLIFYALYPKMHAFYVVAAYPLALLSRGRTLPGFWLPGLIWFALFNGAFGAMGVFYYLAPWTGQYIDPLNAVGLTGKAVLAGALADVYCLLCLCSAWRLLQMNSSLAGHELGFGLPHRRGVERMPRPLRPRVAAFRPART